MTPTLTAIIQAEKPVELITSKGFTVTNFEQPYPVDLFPNSDSFNPAMGLAIGEELNNKFGSKRLIVRPTTPITRKVTDKQEYWPNNILYVSVRDVNGWRY
jgi:hypothetical protein